MIRRVIDRAIKKGALPPDELLAQVITPADMAAEMIPVQTEHTLAWQSRVLDGLGVDVFMPARDPATLAHIDQIVGERIGWITDTTRQIARQALKDGILAGEGIDALTRRMRDTFGDIEKYRVERIARTEANRSANWATMRAHKMSGVVDQREWISTIDTRTRDVHLSMNGFRDIHNGMFKFAYPDGRLTAAPGNSGYPEHDINCRCTTAAVIKDPQGFERLRDARQGFVITKAEDAEPLWRQYDEWLVDWENALRPALARGFKRQETALVDLLRRVYG